MTANARSSKSAPQHTSAFYSSVAVVVVALSAALPISLAQQDLVILPEQSPLPAETNAVTPAAAATEAFAAGITANDVYVRSGPGTDFYHCGKVHRGDKVRVIKTQPGWSCIAPPQGSFSWIAMQYLALNLNDPTMGVVAGNGVWVYAGSDFVPAIQSTSKQVMLNRGDKVKLLGEEKDDYCKIAPPDGAYLWVSSDYIETIGPVAQKSPADANAPGGLITEKASVEQEKLKEFNALKEKVKTEQAKPLQEQNYTEVKKALTELSKNADAGKAARYAEAMLQQIAGFELAKEVGKQVEQQNAGLKDATTKIDKVAASKMTEVKDIGRFVVIGRFETSSVYDTGTAKRYRIIGSSGATVCYAVPTGQAAQMDLTMFKGKKVGLVGTIKAHAPTAGSMVEFTEIVELD